jgi:hypothetical protein
VNVKLKTCEGCGLKQPTFGLPGGKALRFAGCAKGHCVWGSNAPRRKFVFPAGSTRTKRNLLWVTPAVILHHASGTRSTLTSCGPHPPYAARAARATRV